MSGSLLSGLDPAGPIGDADLFYTVQSGADAKATGAQLKTYAAGGLIRFSVTVSANGLICALPAGAAMLMIALQEIAGHTVNCSLGTTSGGSELLSAISVPGGGAPVLIPLDALSQPDSWVAAQNIFLNSASWGLANVTGRLWCLQ